jgi:hypothetical protein
MRLATRFILILLTLVVSMNAQPPMPRLEKHGAVTHLIVDGKPWLSLAGELLNNALRRPKMCGRRGPT